VKPGSASSPSKVDARCSKSARDAERRHGWRELCRENAKLRAGGNADHWSSAVRTAAKVTHDCGYIQTVYPLLLLLLMSDADVTLCLRKKVGEHVVEGTVIGWVWAPSPDDPPPAAAPFEGAVDADVRIGFERTIEQDVAFGIRQQIDIGC
jgi:uncharacterized membrane protein